MNTNNEVIIRRVERDYTRILALYQGVPVATLVAPSFPDRRSVKDAVAQIAGWLWRCAALLNHAHHTDAPLLGEPDIDGLNREFFEERRHWHWVEVETDFRHAHLVLCSAIRDLPPERLESAAVQRAITRETCERYAEHFSHLINWRRQLRHKYPLAA